MALRESGAVALTTLIKSALKAKTDMDELVSILFPSRAHSFQKRQQLVLSPLSALSEVEYVDVRRRQMDCVILVVQSEGAQLRSPLWSPILGIFSSIVTSKST